MQIEIPLLPSHPHPQFVAVKSLISFSSEIDIYNVSYASRRKVLRKKINFEKIFWSDEQDISVRTAGRIRKSRKHS